MNIEELLCCDLQQLASREGFEKYIKDIGLIKVRKKDLDKIVNKFGVIVFGISGFSEVYQLITSDDTNRTMKRWTIAIGIMTFFIFLMTAAMLMKNY